MRLIKDRWFWIFVGWLTFVALACVFTLQAQAEWPRVAQYWPDNMSPQVMEWFSKQASKGHGNCCSKADGYPTNWDEKDNKYFVYDDKSWGPDEAVWREVPEDALIRESKNPTGRGIVWYMASKDANGYYGIRCFVPGPES